MTRTAWRIIGLCLAALLAGAASVPAWCPVDECAEVSP